MQKSMSLNYEPMQVTLDSDSGRIRGDTRSSAFFHSLAHTYTLSHSHTLSLNQLSQVTLDSDSGRIRHALLRLRGALRFRV